MSKKQPSGQGQPERATLRIGAPGALEAMGIPTVPVRFPNGSIGHVPTAVVAATQTSAPDGGTTTLYGFPLPVPPARGTTWTRYTFSPPGVDPEDPWGFVYESSPRHLGFILRVIETRALEQDDGHEWQHVSVSAYLPSTRDRRTGRSFTQLPTWDDMVLVKRTFMGADTYAYQVLPPTDRHISLHDTTLHMWRRVTGDGPNPLPDFTRGGDTI